jgi:hypothetical protein
MPLGIAPSPPAPATWSSLAVALGAADIITDDPVPWFTGAILLNTKYGGSHDEHRKAEPLARRNS